jgi:NAD(P)-dependent dehydrogenase (short-subunit alcohol dehydrogenase family)
MDLKLEGKRVLVTGSSSGIGEAIAREFAQEGASVVVHGRNAERAKRVADSINSGTAASKKGRAVVALGDLSKDSEADAVASKAIELLGGIDILVNNAGGADEGMKPWLETPPEQWAETYSQNVLSFVRLIRRLVPGMKQAKWGRVIQIASGVATQPFPMGPDYGAAKAAMVNATVSFAKDLANTGITVNTVSPGPIFTPALERAFRDIAKQQGWGEDWAEIEKKAVQFLVPNPAGRIGTPADVAAAVLFLASPRGGYVNGSNLRVDGGYVTAIN